MRLSASAVCYEYETKNKKGSPVLSDLSFVAEQGSYWCIAGPNGSGKSTFLKLACGLFANSPFKGELKWDDRTIEKWNRLEIAREVAFVPGTLKTMFGVPVSEFVLQGRFAKSQLWTRPGTNDRDLVNQAMVRVGISELANSEITKISAGELQLAMIARALVQEPKVLVLDEATANLDLKHQWRVFELLESLNKQGTTILLVSHDLNLASEFCPNVLWLKKGSVYKQGTMSETLTTQLMRGLYDVGETVEVGKNPFTSRPKIFWRT